MADTPQSGTLQDDELDFRPHPTARVATPGIVAARSNERGISLGEARQQLRGEGYDFSRYNDESVSPFSITAKRTQPAARPAAVSDDIDFQPTKAAAKPQRPASSDGIDFKPAEKPASNLRTPTLDELTTGRPAGAQTPSLTDRAAKMGRTTTSLGVPDNFFVDATKSARNVFTNEFQQPGMATEEEKARWRASLSDEKRQQLEEFEARQATEGTPYKGAVVIGQGVKHLARNIRDIAGDVSGLGPPADPSQSLTDVTGFVPPESRREHPIATGVTQAVTGLGSPENASLMVASGGLSSLPALARAGISAYFAAQMAKGAYDQIPGIQEAWKRGDTSEVKRLATLAGVDVLMGAAAGAHGIREAGLGPEAAPSPFVEKGTVSGPLAMDRAVARGGRRMEDLQANEAARRGMGNLAFAERAMEAAKQARINEPVEIPPTRGEPTILQGRPQGPERNPLEVEAGRAREEQAARERPAYTVKDLRRVVPEDPSQPPYYVLGGPEANAPRGSVERPGAADLIGARGRSKGVSEVASRVLADRDKSLVTRFGPDVLEDARQELQAAAGLASSFERPGRYFAEYGDQSEHMPSRSTNAAKGIHAGGTWYGVSSARGDIEGMHPWYADVAEGPETFAKIAQEGKGAAYDRILERVATHIQAERESARPVIEEFAPQLRNLAGQVRDVDPDLAESLASLAEGKSVGFRNLREYIEGKLHDAQAAALFSRAVDEAASETGEPAGAEEPSRLGSEARTAEGRGEETTREPAGPVTSPGHDGIDFEPSHPIHPQEVEDMSRLLGRRITAEELPGIRRRLEAERNVEAGLRGERRDVAGEIREEHRTKLERGEILPGMETAVREQREAAAAEQGRQLTERANRPPESIEETAGKMERESPLFRGTAASPQKEIFNQSALDAAKDAAAEKPKVPGTTLYSNAFLDPAAWREAFPGAVKALVRIGDTTLSAGDIMKGILREQTGELVRRKEQLYKALEAKANEWDARPTKEQLDFILREQRGQKQVNAADQTMADKLRQMFAERREQIENLGHGAFQRWRENYFPQMWERPNQVRDWITQVLAGKRRMEGPASFKKQRVFDDIQEGIDAGFKPLTTNPVTLALAKLHEMDRYAMAHTTLDSMKKAGMAKAVMVGQEAPAGWERLSEGMGTIYGGGDIPVKEAYDKAVWDRLSEVANNLGIEHKRAVGIGGTRLGYATPGEITTRFATPESVIAHEIGHNLDWKYGLKDQLVKNPLYAKELRALADLHIEGMSPADVPKSFQRYIRKGEEKMATMVEALIHAPDKFREVAPNTWDFLHKFIADKPELKPLLEAKPSLRYDTRTSPVSAGGIVIHGYYYAPKEAARVFNNYLSPGLQRFKTYNAVRMVGNTLNQAQLGLSAFHLGFTSIDASVSDMALALERVSRGEVARAMTPAMRSVSVLGSPINTLLKGNKLLREYMEPGRFAEMARLADAVAQAGGRVHMDPYYKNQAIESFWKAWKEGSYAKAGLRAFPAAMEYAAKPVMEYAVPRMKLGVFANLAEDVLARSEREDWKPEKRRFELNRAWDSVDNRMGQIVYDNLFWNRAVKDLGLVSVRSLGWNLGTAREIGGGAVDTAKQLARVATGEKAELTHRMAYVMALPIVVGFTGALVHYLSTGKKPETLTDYYFPQTGKIGPNGRPERLSLPSYVKDIVELNQHPARTVLNKVHPAITATAQFLRNEDYYGTEIHHSDDPFLRQRLDDAEFIAKQFLPFSIRNAYQRAESAGSTGVAGPVEKRSLPGTLESMIGLVPAPRSLMETTAERKAHEGAVRNMPQGPRTREQFEHSVLLRSYQNRIRSGEMKLGDLRDEIATGRITVHDAEKIAHAARSNPLEQDFARLSLADALDVWNVATPEEREQLRPQLFRKGGQLKNMPADERQVFEKRLREALRGQAQPTPGANFWDGALRTLQEQRQQK